MINSLIDTYNTKIQAIVAHTHQDARDEKVWAYEYIYQKFNQFTTGADTTCKKKYITCSCQELITLLNDEHESGKRTPFYQIIDFNQPCRLYLVLNYSLVELMDMDNTIGFINWLSKFVIDRLDKHLKLCFKEQHLCIFNEDTVQILEAHVESRFYAQITVSDIAFNSTSISLFAYMLYFSIYLKEQLQLELTYFKSSLLHTNYWTNLQGLIEHGIVDTGQYMNGNTILMDGSACNYTQDSSQWYS